MPSKYDASTRAKAIRLVRDHGGDYRTEWAAITAVAGAGDERGDAAQVDPPGRGR